MNLSPEKKIAGILSPLFALRGEDDLGIGDTATLREFIDRAAEIGFKLVQLLPINEIGADNSPYNAISAIAIEPTTLHLAPGSPQDLTRQDFDASLNEADVSGLRGGAVRYRQVKELKKRLLEKAFENFSANASEDRRSEFRKFFQQESAWLGDYVFFRVLMEVNKDSAAWDRWPAQHRRIERARNWLHNLPQDQQAALAKRQEFFCYIQWIAHQQWRATKSFAEERGVALMGDIPFGVSYCSADVFARPDEFVLDWFGSRSIGGRECARTIFSGGASGCAASAASSICFGSTMSRAFTASTPFRGGRDSTKNFSRSMSTKCWNELAAAPRISFPTTTTHPRIVKQTNAKVKDTCALCWKKLAVCA